LYAFLLIMNELKETRQRIQGNIIHNVMAEKALKLNEKRACARQQFQRLRGVLQFKYTYRFSVLKCTSSAASLRRARRRKFAQATTKAQANAMLRSRQSFHKWPRSTIESWSAFLVTGAGLFHASHPPMPRPRARSYCGCQSRAL
jgi:hypothetical protein